MLKCKIGIVSISYDDPTCFLVLGLIKPSIKNKSNELYKIHSFLKYLNPFIVKIVSGNIILENMNEILSFLKYFNIKLNLELKNMNKKVYKFRRPELYDISCNCPLFDVVVKQQKLDIETKYKEQNKVFVLFPIEDVILRGKIIDNSRYSYLGANIHFITLGNKSKLNTRNTSILNKRYLLTLGVNSNIIYCFNELVEFPDIILEIIEHINLFLQKDNYSIVFLIPKNDRIQLFKHINSLKSLSLISEKVKISFISE
jgi:hypothetical protein